MRLTLLCRVVSLEERNSPAGKPSPLNVIDLQLYYSIFWVFSDMSAVCRLPSVKGEIEATCVASGGLLQLAKEAATTYNFCKSDDDQDDEVREQADATWQTNIADHIDDWRDVTNNTGENIIARPDPVRTIVARRAGE